MSVYVFIYTQMYFPYLICRLLILCMYSNIFSIENVCETLKTSGFTQVNSHTPLVGNVFCKDKHCSNVLLFPRQLSNQLEKINLVTEHTLIIQVIKTHRQTSIISANPYPGLICVYEYRINLAVWPHVRFARCWWRMETFSWWDHSQL